MALIRLTADNADDVIQQVVGDFAELVRGAGKSPALAKLEEQASELENLVGSRVLEVEVILGDVADKWIAPLASWLQLDAETLRQAISSTDPIELPTRLDGNFSVVRIRSGRQPAGRRAGQRKPPILVVVHTPETAPEQELKDAVFDAVQEHPLSLLLVPADAGWAKALANLASRETWMCKAIGLELLGERSLAENLGLSPWKEAGPFMLGWSATGSLGSLYEGLGLAIEKEQRSLKSKRTVLDQKAAVSQRRATGNASEIIGDVRGFIQKEFDTFQKASAKRMRSLVAQFDGSLSQEIEATIKAFDEFDYEKKPKVFIVRVPVSVQKQLLAQTKERLTEAGREDLVKMGELFRRVQEETERLVESKGGPPAVVHFNYLPDHQLTNLIDRTVAIQRPYSGTLARRGPMDYFMAARRYQMVFFMMFSAFGLSFVRSYRQIMVPLTVLLLSFGLLNVVNSTRKQEKETKSLELEKARELLRAELRRCMNEIDKNWSSILSSHLSSQQAAVVEKIDATVNSYFEGASRKADDERALQQRQTKGLDQAERKLTEAMKKVQSAPQELEQLVGQLTQMFVASTRPGTGAPRIPGAPAVPGAAPVPGAAGVARPASAPRPGASPAVPAAAAEALKKLQSGQKAAAGARPAAAAAKPAAGAAGADLKKKLAEARSKGTAGRQKPKSAPAGGEGAQEKAARLKERLAQQAKPPAAETPAAEAPAVKASPVKTPAAKTPAAKGSEDLAAKAARLRERAAAFSESAEKAPVPPPVAAAADDSEDAPSKQAAVEKRVAELQEKMAAAKAGELQTDSGDQAPSSTDDDETDRGALMKKKAEEIKRKMAEAAGQGEEGGGLDKTVMMPKRPVSDDGDQTG